MTSKRYITLSALDGKRVPLNVYVTGVKLAIANPDREFKHGLTTWWPTKGREIREQFREGIHERINSKV